VKLSKCLEVKLQNFLRQRSLVGSSYICTVGGVRDRAILDVIVKEKNPIAPTRNQTSDIHSCPAIFWLSVWMGETNSASKT
jgi:hypothetical protein